MSETHRRSAVSPRIDKTLCIDLNGGLRSSASCPKEVIAAFRIEPRRFVRHLTDVEPFFAHRPGPAIDSG